MNSVREAEIFLTASCHDRAETLACSHKVTRLHKHTLTHNQI